MTRFRIHSAYYMKPSGVILCPTLHFYTPEHSRLHSIPCSTPIPPKLPSFSPFPHFNFYSPELPLTHTIPNHSPGSLSSLTLYLYLSCNLWPLPCTLPGTLPTSLPCTLQFGATNKTDLTGENKSTRLPLEGRAWPHQRSNDLELMTGSN
ncbi:hypothetical protein E2C01_026435 [Portunus trituberculatus]|uniref:Uncharacterized protein n=1 Tax=Portunus trituberculatus TaxID=210409 RepID=A0A5B7EJ61_PORTR|nr:hypothetical protein [Portunus trituberculatus]